MVTVSISHYNVILLHSSLAWPDPILAQGHYRFQYKYPCVKKGLGKFTVLTCTVVLRPTDSVGR